MLRTDYPYLAEVSQMLTGLDWLLVGGTMVQLHCQLANVTYSRATYDFDVVVLPTGQSTLGSVKTKLACCQLLENNGLIAIPSLGSNVLHHFKHPDRWHIDVMVKDRHNPVKWEHYTTVQCPGSDSASGYYHDRTPKESLKIQTTNGESILIPNIWSAIALKGYAFRTPSSNIDRHIQDALALFACSTRYKSRRLTKSERKAYNFLLSSSALSNLENWSELGEQDIERALSGIFEIRQDTDMKFPPEIEEVELKIRQKKTSNHNMKRQF